MRGGRSRLLALQVPACSLCHSTVARGQASLEAGGRSSGPGNDLSAAAALSAYHLIWGGDYVVHLACAGAWDAAQPERATGQPGRAAGQPGYLAGGFRLVVAANKADLLPHHIPRARLEVGDQRQETL